ncbi:MAG: sigma-54 dependent transcriptional regulator [Melioribacteraceae bacterium]|nr:sigma-54 dependent transcriptional regulator [Melioribacteraceae bacterium]
MTKKELQEKFGIIGRSKALSDLCDIVLQVAQSDISVLINGESGVGKEVIAKALHGASNRADKKLVSVNCGAIPEGILESELFGHKKGSFTGSTEDRKGYFEIADGGTLFLDEIAEMPLTTQVKLLRVLETQEFMRIGSETVTKVDVRIIAATNKNLQQEVNSKSFRNDLYFRLKAVTLYIPPLRERKEDILPLTNFFLLEYSVKNKTEFRFSSEALDLITSYFWPGNVRELKNTVETAAALTPNEVIPADTLLNLINVGMTDEEKHNLPVHLNKSPESLDREMIYRALIEIKKDLNELKSFATSVQNGSVDFEDKMEMDEIVPLDSLERKAISNALDYTRGNKRKAAKLLNISERTLYRKLKEYSI